MRRPLIGCAYLSFCSLVCVLSAPAAALDIGAYSYASTPMPGLRINGRQGMMLPPNHPDDQHSLRLYPGQPVTLEVELESGEALAQPADWWMVATSGAAQFYWHAASQSWLAGLQPAYRGALMDFPAIPLPPANVAFPPGEFDVYFGVDTQVGQLFSPQLRYAHLHISVPATAQRVFFVSRQGNDANPGSLEQPWKTLAQAAAHAQAGDLVWVRGGTYAEQLVPKNSGTAAQPLVFAAYPGETVTLDGSGLNLIRNTSPTPPLPPFSGVIHLHGLQHLWIVGFTVKNSSDIGIMGYNCDDLVIQDNYVTESASSGIAVWNSRQVLVSHNEINRANKSKGQENLSIGENVNDFEVSYNHIHHSATTTGNGGEGMDIKEGSSNGNIHHNHIHDISLKLCLYVDAWDTLSQNLRIHDNILHDCNPHGIAITAERGGTIKQVRVYNNVIYNNKITGVHVGAGFQPNTDGVYIYNNSFYNNGKGNNFGASVMLKNSNAKNIQVFNNACASTIAQVSVLSSISNLSIQNNLFIRKQSTGNGEQNGSPHFVGDPLWVNPGAGDFRLRAGSPAIGQGAPQLAPITDLRGQQR